MNLLEKKEQLRLILKQSDLINTLNGGIVDTAVNILRSEGRIIINVSAPSVSGKAFKVLLNHEQLTIFSLLTAEDFPFSRGESTSVPMFIKTFEIPGNIDLDNIQAEQNDDELNVMLPLIDDNRSQRIIDIREL
jgi:HSP20 family protein